MTTYELCGTCSISCSENETVIFLFPANGYLSPCKGFAVLYSFGSTNALLQAVNKIDGNDKQHAIELSISINTTTIGATKLFSILSHAAATQRKIKLIVEKYDDDLQITHCLFPAS